MRGLTPRKYNLFFFFFLRAGRDELVVLRANDSFGHRTAAWVDFLKWLGCIRKSWLEYRRGYGRLFFCNIDEHFFAIYSISTNYLRKASIFDCRISSCKGRNCQITRSSRSPAVRLKLAIDIYNDEKCVFSDQINYRSINLFFSETKSHSESLRSTLFLSRPK